MTLKDKATVERLLGVIEGVAFALDDKYAQPICDAVVNIDEILDKERAQTMTDRDRLIELNQKAHIEWLQKEYDHETDKNLAEYSTDYLLANGVIVPRKVKGYTNYFIDEYGNVYSLKTHKYLSQEKGKDGYYYVQLCENGKRKRISVHRLVAETFIKNPCNLPMVNHKDENRENNEVNNLEWCTEKYNTNYGNARAKQAKAVSKAVVCIETSEVFFSQKEAGFIKGIAHQHICDCCKGKKRTCGGYHWRYATKEEAEAKLKEQNLT